MIVGFTGTRQGPTPAQHDAMHRFLTAMFTEHGAKVLVHGGAAGCDTLAHHTAPSTVEVWIFPANEGVRSSVVTTPMGNCLIGEPVPALVRNRIIVGLADGLLAVPATDTEEQRSGTWATVRYARERGCPVYVVLRDGSIVRDAPRCDLCRIDEVRTVCRHPSECHYGKVQKLARLHKVAHIRRSRQTRDHKCHWPGCTEMVPPAKWGCVSHWRRLPKRLRDRVWDTYRIGQEEDQKPSREYVTVAREVRNWIKAKGDPL